MSDPIRIKRGDTFILALKVWVGEVGGAAQDLTGWTIRSSVGTIDGKVADLTVNLLPQDDEDTTGEFVLHGKSNSWPLGELVFDIRYTTGTGQVITTQEGRILLTRSVTP